MKILSQETNYAHTQGGSDIFIEENKTPVHSYSIEEYVTRVPSLDQKQNWPRALAQRAITTALLPLEVRKAQQLLHKERPLKLHIGCGNTYLAGWINIDLARPGKRRDLRWDLRRGLPFPDGAVEAIFSEHFFEHLEVADGLRFLKECKRVLAPGGVLRIGVPDLERYIHSYLGADNLLEDYRSGRPTQAIAFGEIFFFHGHRSMYDFETLKRILVEVGFAVVRRSAFGESKLTPSPDSEDRRQETLYVEAIK